MLNEKRSSERLKQDRWEQEYEALMEVARNHLDPAWEHGEVVVLRTTKGNLHIARIHDYQNGETRKPLENRCIERLRSENDTGVLCILATIRGETPDSPSWNFREGLIRLNERNLQTERILWGGDDAVIVKPFHRLLPSNYQTRDEKQNKT